MVCQHHYIIIIPLHIPDKLKTRADSLSRVNPVNTEGSLSHRVFRAIVRQTLSPQVDMCATRHNHQILKLVSPYPDLLNQGPHLHHNPALFHLHAWIVSEQRYLREDFQRRLPALSPILNDPLQGRYMIPNGSSSVVGVLRDNQITSQSLQLS